MLTQEINPAEGRALLDQGDTVLTDVREADEHARERIPGARSAPLSGLPFSLDVLAHRVIFHCRSGARTAAAADRLAASTDAETYLLTGGIQAWKAAGYPVQLDQRRRIEIIFMLVVGLTMLRRRKTSGDPGVQLSINNAATLLPWLIGIGAVVGFLSGFFGIGGGFLIVPGLMLATGMPLAMAIGTSLVAVAAFGAATAASYAMSGMVDWTIATLFTGGGLAGGLIGVSIGRALAHRKRALTIVFASLVIVAGAYVTYRGAMTIDPSLLS